MPKRVWIAKAML